MTETDNPNDYLKLESRPLYDRAIGALELFIEKGQYKPGDKLPSEEALAKQLGVSRTTVREALGNLEAQGVIRRRHGVGTFVTAPTRRHLRGGLDDLESLRSLAERAGINEKLVEWVVAPFSATDKIAGKLEVEPDAPLVRAQATAASDRCLFAYLDNYISEQYIDLNDLKRFKKGTLLDYLVEHDEVRISYTFTNIYCVKADTPVASRLQVPENEPVLHLEEVFYSESGKPVVLALNYFLTDNFNFHIVRCVVRR
jgi:GntR family transcriptional regulator